MERRICIVADDADEVSALADRLYDLGGIVPCADIIGRIPAAIPAALQFVAQKLGHMGVAVSSVAQDKIGLRLFFDIRFVCAV